MNRVDIEGVDPVDADGAARRGLTGPLGTTDLACNHYRIPPGETFPGGLHTHLDQEEVFVVLSGEATFEWYVPASDGDDAESGEFAVAAGGAVRFAPGEFQSGRNGGEEELVALALGAPRDSSNTRIPVACPDCELPVLELTAGADGITLRCPDCGAEHVPAPCPDCGDERVESALGGEGRPVVVWRDCGSQFDRPPVGSDAGVG